MCVTLRISYKEAVLQFKPQEHEFNINIAIPLTTKEGRWY